MAATAGFGGGGRSGAKPPGAMAGNMSAPVLGGHMDIWADAAVPSMAGIGPANAPFPVVSALS